MNGGIVEWLGGLPFIGIIIVYGKQSNIEKLFSSNLKFRSGKELEGHITYVLQLVLNHKVDKQAYMLLIGYIEKHKEICVEDDCPLKVPKKNKRLKSDDMEENCAQLIKQIEKMFKLGVKKYPQCTKLRLSHAFFYLERTKDKDKAYRGFT